MKYERKKVPPEDSVNTCPRIPLASPTGSRANL